MKILALFSALIVALLLGGRPAAVAGCVVPVIVDAVDAKAFARALPHVGEEVFELQPAFANGDAATAVPRPIFAVGIRAAIDDAAPNAVLDGVRPAVRHLGRGQPHEVLAFQAPAGSLPPGAQVRTSGGGIGTAVADAAPIHLTLSTMGDRDHGESVEVLAGQIYEAHSPIVALEVR